EIGFKNTPSDPNLVLTSFDPRMDFIPNNQRLPPGFNDESRLRYGGYQGARDAGLVKFYSELKFLSDTYFDFKADLTKLNNNAIGLVFLLRDLINANWEQFDV